MSEDDLWCADCGRQLRSVNEAADRKIYPAYLAALLALGKIRDLTGTHVSIAIAAKHIAREALQTEPKP